MKAILAKSRLRDLFNPNMILKKFSKGRLKGGWAKVEVTEGVE